VQSLIAMRKQHPAFQLNDPATHLRFIDSLPAGVLVFVIDAKGLNDTWKKVLVVYNANAENVSFQLGPIVGRKRWTSYLWQNRTDESHTVFSNTPFLAEALSCTILYQ
jgi:hypothetical protein